MNTMAPPVSYPVPLAVDVDGTLLRTDLLHEAGLHFLRHHPLEAPKLFMWMLGGRARLKSELADRVMPAIGTLPIRRETADLIAAAQAEGRPVYLASASDERYVAQLAERLGADGYFGTTRERNLAGDAKAQCLDDAFGRGGYDYIGDRRVDMPIWKAARKQFVVAHDASLERSVVGAFADAEVIARPRIAARTYLKAMRTHQWAKNALLFVGLIAGHHFSFAALSAVTIAFICFSAAASSAYIVNDLLDLQGDRAHPTKRNRPFAAGDLPITHGIGLAAVLMVVALSLAIVLPPLFMVALVGYVVATLAYSLVLKRKALVDVIVLGSLYTIRVYAGLAAADVPGSPWLLMVSLFLFLCLAMEKRCSELVRRREAGEGASEQLSGRNYRVADLAILFPLAAAAGYGAVLVIALYLASDEVQKLYGHPERLWLICPLVMYWISRNLMLSNRNEMHDDPVIFALTDRISWYVAASVAFVIAISI